MKDQKVILFDGHCNLCIRSVKFIDRHDREHLFRPVELQSDEGRQYAESLDVDVDNPHSVILLDGDEVSRKSRAGLRILESMKSTRLVARLLSILPRWLNDFFYDIIARHRHRLFGKKNS